jgi:putative FmdB family regulatory protein
MPIYEYRCSACGHEMETLRKLADPPLTECPACHAETLVKKVSAAGFQLKGSGWYVTDFRNGNKPAAAKKDGEKAAPATDKAADGASTDSKSADTPASAPAPAAKTDTAPPASTSSTTATTAAPAASSSTPASTPK